MAIVPNLLGARVQFHGGRFFQGLCVFVWFCTLPGSCARTDGASLACLTQFLAGQGLFPICGPGVGDLCNMGCDSNLYSEDQSIWSGQNVLGYYFLKSMACKGLNITFPCLLTGALQELHYPHPSLSRCILEAQTCPIGKYLSHFRVQQTIIKHQKHLIVSTCWNIFICVAFLPPKKDPHWKCACIHGRARMHTGTHTTRAAKPVVTRYLFWFFAWMTIWRN